jgi:phage terminase small subunit
MPGPQPTPTATLALRGSWRANQRQSEPAPAIPADVRVPASLKGRARKLWNELAPRLHAAGLLTTVDLLQFERFCRLRAAWETAMATVEENPDRANVLALGKLDEMVRKLEQAFALSPADRTKVRTEAPASEDPKERFFKRAS